MISSTPPEVLARHSGRQWIARLHGPCARADTASACELRAARAPPGVVLFYALSIWLKIDGARWGRPWWWGRWGRAGPGGRGYTWYLIAFGVHTLDIRCIIP